MSQYRIRVSTKDTLIYKPSHSDLFISLEKSPKCQITVTDSPGQISDHVMSPSVFPGYSPLRR
jgi:hypothetical protein